MALSLKHFFVMLCIFVADQLSKFFVVSYLSNSFFVLPFLKLTLVRNTGVAFGLFNNLDFRWFFVLISIAVIIFLFNYSRNQKNQLALYSISLIIAGALGNVVDRVLFGSVVDFIDFGWWPAFNVADSSITIGVLLLLLSSIKE